MFGLSRSRRLQAEGAAASDPATGYTDSTAAAGTVTTGGSSTLRMLARLVSLATTIAVLLIAVAVALHLLDANPGNSIVKALHDAGAWLAGPFVGMFHLHNQDLQMLLNWGIAAIVYLLVGSVIASMIARAAAPRVRTATPVTA